MIISGEYDVADLQLLQSCIDDSQCVQPEHGLPRPLDPHAACYQAQNSAPIEYAAEAFLPLICPYLRKLSVRGDAENHTTPLWGTAAMQSCKDKFLHVDGPL